MNRRNLTLRKTDIKKLLTPLYLTHPNINSQTSKPTIQIQIHDLSNLLHLINRESKSPTQQNIQINREYIDKIINDMLYSILDHLKVPFSGLKHKQIEAIKKGIESSIEQNTFGAFKVLKGECPPNSNFFYLYSKVFVNEIFANMFKNFYKYDFRTSTKQKINADEDKYYTNELLDLIAACENLGRLKLEHLENLHRKDEKYLEKLPIPVRVQIYNLGNDILDKMERFRSHLIEKHVNKSDAELFQRLNKENLLNVACFTDKDTAVRVVQESLKKNIFEIERWLDNPKSRNKLEIICKHSFSIGKGIKKGENQVRYNLTKSRLILLKNSASELGFMILTGFPELD